LAFDYLLPSIAFALKPPKPAEPITKREEGEGDGTTAATKTTESSAFLVVTNTPHSGLESLKES